MENIVYDDVHTSATDIRMDNIVSCGNICYDNAPAIKSELAINNSISKGAICCDQVPKPVSVGANIKHTTKSGVIRYGRRNCKAILLIIIFIGVIILILSATCAGTVCTLLQLLQLKSEIGYASTASMEFGDNSSDSQVNASSLNMLHQQINDLTDTLNNSIEEKEQLKMMNASFHVLRQQINDLAGTLNTSNQQIQVRENKKEHVMNASLDILHQQINHLFSFSCAAVLLFNSSSPSGYYSITSSNGSSVRVYSDMMVILLEGG